jgi:glycosyltransferase involved in cell wall biosynthesis
MVTVARLAREKDQSTLLRAAALARTSLTDLQLWIVGDGPLRRELEALVQELQLDGCVVFAGERQDAGRWLQAADLFVLSSISEGLPLSVLEAMAAGLPLVLTSVGGMPEMVELAHGGYTVKPSDPAGLARAILDVAADRALREKWGGNNQAAYREQLTDTVMAENYLRLYGEQLGKGARRDR